MKIDANIRVEEKAFADSTISQVASGWVELEDCIKFPVKVRKYTDKQDKTEKLFVSYPQRKTQDGYAPVVYPDRETRNEIEEYVLEEVKKQIVKGINAPPVTEVEIMLPDRKKWNLSENVTALASMKIAGVKITGIMVKEGRNGLFVQMPQHRADGEYKDTVYGTSSFVQTTIKTAILEAYEEKIRRSEPEPPAVAEEKTAVPESGTQEMSRQGDDGGQPEQVSMKESIERLTADYEQNNMEKLLSDISRVVFVPKKALLVSNSSGMTASQSASIRSEDSADYIVAEFYNTYDGAMVSEEEPAECGIDIKIYKDGEYAGYRKAYRRESVTPEEAEKNYRETMEQWQKMITVKPVQEAEKTLLTVEEGRELLLAAYDAGDKDGMKTVMEYAGDAPQLAALYRELTGEQTHIRKATETLSADAPRL